jgi:predicted DNA-binding transcriptional regulator YafY
MKSFKELECAIATGQHVTFIYLSSERETSHRQIFPKRLFGRREIIYCQAFDIVHEEYRVFRLDRMSGLNIGAGDKRMQ